MSLLDMAMQLNTMAKAGRAADAAEELKGTNEDVLQAAKVLQLAAETMVATAERIETLLAKHFPEK